MGTGYTRNDTANNIADGNVINASDLDGEFDAVQAAFNGTTGHSHDGTSGEGPQIASGGIAADAINGSKIADDSIDSEHYVDGSIDTAHIGNLQVTTAKIAADAIDGTKIADDVIDSEHYVAGSIDAEHLASNSVTSAKLDTNIQVAGTLGVTGETTLSTHLNMGDNDIIKLGDSADLQIYHDGTNSFIKDNGTGGIFIRATSNIKMESTDGNRVLAEFTDSAGSDLYYNNSKKLATASGGISVTGDITVTGTVDGRDVATDGTKLDGIASSADNYSSWTISDGSTSEAISSGNTLTIAGGGDTSTSYNTGTNTLTITTNAPEAFASGTSMLFQQTSAPTGWTKQTVHNDKAIRLTTGTVGTGGSAAFSTAFATPSVAGGSVSGNPGSNLAVNAGNLAVSVSGNIANHTLSNSQIPAHSHNFSFFKYNNTQGLSSGNPTGSVQMPSYGANANATTANSGGNGAHSHNHNLSGNMSGNPTLSGNVTAGNLAVGASTASINVNYVDFIIANKD